MAIYKRRERGGGELGETWFSSWNKSKSEK
jgi:hypothetical protein